MIDAHGSAGPRVGGFPGVIALSSSSDTSERDRRFSFEQASDLRVDRLAVSAYRVPTDGPDGKESDGTLEWASTTMVLVEVRAGGVAGLGYTYADASVASLIESTLEPAVLGSDPLCVASIWRRMVDQLRNVGQPGAGFMALSAVDVALWDLKAKLLGLPLFKALDPFHDSAAVYASGGFCNYPVERLVAQVSGWVEQGIPRIKIKISRDPDRDPERLTRCRAAIGDATLLLTDSNGALSRKQALYWARRLREDWQVVWLEEALSSDDRVGLRWLRERGPAGLEITAGEYGSVLRDFNDLLQAEAVDCLQPDVTRCGGITGLRQVSALCSAHHIDVSAHGAPALSAHAFCAVERLRHLEYFHDHVRIEQRFFDGVLCPIGGRLHPDPGRPGLGLELKRSDAEPYLVHRAAAQLEAR